MTACATCARALQPAWKFCIYCGARVEVVEPVVAPDLPVAELEAIDEPAPVEVAPVEPAPVEVATRDAAAVDAPPVKAQAEALPHSSADAGAAPAMASRSRRMPAPVVLPGSPGSALPAIPAAVPPVADAPIAAAAEAELRAVEAPEAELPATEEPAAPALPDPFDVAPVMPVHVEPTAAEPEAERETEPETEFEPEPELDSDDEALPPAPSFFSETPVVPRPSWREARQLRKQESARASQPTAEANGALSRATTSTDTLIDEPESEPDLDDWDDDDEPVDRTGAVNVLAVLALIMGVLASPLAALFGHLALNQLKTSRERGVIPAWIAVVLGYLWLGVFLVLGISYLVTNG